MRLLALILAAGVLSGQTPSAHLSFDAASIKPVRADAAGKPYQPGNISLTPGNLTMRSASLWDMVLTAYAIKDHQLTGPNWMKLENYDIVAKAAGDAPASEVRLMLQSLLADRFKLAIHRDTKDLAIYAMVLGKGDPKIGPKKPEGASTIDIDRGKVVFRNYTMAMMADFLSQRSPDRPIIDATGIEGWYDIAIQMADSASGDPGEAKRAMGQAMRDGSLARMASEQLGLKLDPRKGPTEIVVVDHIEKTPSEN